MTIMDWLENAEHNLGSPYPNSILVRIALEQLQNAILLLGRGYSVHTNVDELISRYGAIDSIPPRGEEDITTISDWLEDAEHDLNSPLLSTRLAGMAQYIFANNLLGKGYTLYTNVDELLTMYGSVDSIPSKQEHDAQC